MKVPRRSAKPRTRFWLVFDAPIANGHILLGARNYAPFLFLNLAALIDAD